MRSSQKRVYGVQNSRLSKKGGIGAIKGCACLQFDIAVFFGYKELLYKCKEVN